MKNLARMGSGLMLLLVFGSSFAWGSWSSYVGYSGSRYCSATRPNGYTRWGEVRQYSDTSCSEGFCWGFGWGVVGNVTSTTESADLAIQSRHANFSPSYSDEKYDAPAFYDALVLFWNSGNDFDITSRCRVQ